ncbi:MAG: RecQ family ATP-dependent DNA helicase, partial [Clostridia bacterium]|nr:RecQ family ATP-dependent DNA helicase [Clostridia bacterium]
MNKIETLGHYFGYHAFRPGQEEVIDRILEGTDVLAIMPTGAGKSLCYQVPALMLPGTCLVISPLISLMKDQVMALKTAGVPAAYLNASLTEKQMHLAMERAANGAYKIIYVAPERLRTPGFQYLASRLEISLVAVDEAHCVSHWGHEFRPEYQKIAGFVQSLKTRPRYCAFTATATEEVRTDIIRLLELKRPYITATGFDRPNLFFEVRHPKDRDSELISLCREMQSQAGIVYCMSRKNVETVCDLLRQEGLKATRYHAGLSDEERRENQDLFQFDKAQIMVATNAFGMGIDKSNVRYVIHYNLPLSMEGYYQEAGRAGRDGLESKCILLFQKRDIGLGEYLLENSESSADIPESERIQIKDMEFRRFRDMQRYAETRGCLRHFILRYFGEKSAAVCGNCSSCRRMQHHALPGRLQKDRQEAGAAFARQREYAPVHTQ